MQKKTVSTLLRDLLGQAPSKVGLRLQPERALASRLGVNHYTVRAAFDDLLKEGYLMRKHGSGTYVRKVPKLESVALLDQNAAPLKLNPEDLFVADQNRDVRFTIPNEKRMLSLDLWNDYEDCYGPQIASSILRGIQERTNELGHALVTHSMIEKIDVPLAPEKLAERLREAESDGFIVVSRWARQFQQACETVFGANLPPIVYIQSHSSRIVEEAPLIQTDVAEALARAVYLLSLEGYQKIALLTYESSFRSYESQQRPYERAVEDIGLEYLASEFCALDKASMTNAMESLLDRKDPPEAIYVADDHLLSTVAKVLRSRNLRPGHDIGIITLSNVESKLPKGHEWSRLEFNPEMIGRTSVDSLLAVIQTAGHEHGSISHQAAWWPGDTHKRKNR